MTRLLLPVLLLFCSYSNAQIKAEDVNTFTLKNGMKFLIVEDNSICTNTQQQLKILLKGVFSWVHYSPPLTSERKPCAYYKTQITVLMRY